MQTFSRARRHLPDLIVKAAAGVMFAAVAGCGESGDGAPAPQQAKPPRAAESSAFVAYDATLVTNINLTASPTVTMGYASLDGTGEWLRMFEPSEAATEESALACIERMCKRCDKAEADALLPLYLAETRLAGATVGGTFEVWEVAKALYLVVESEDGPGTPIVLFDFVLFDGKDLRRLVPFATLPESGKVWDCIRQARANPAALNNIAAMLCNDVALRSAVSRQYINFLLLLAGGAGDPIACRNLALYYASSLADDIDKDYKRDFWLRRTREAVLEKQQGFAPALEDRPIADWPQ